MVPRSVRARLVGSALPAVGPRSAVTPTRVGISACISSDASGVGCPALIDRYVGVVERVRQGRGAAAASCDEREDGGDHRQLGHSSRCEALLGTTAMARIEGNRLHDPRLGGSSSGDRPATMRVSEADVARSFRMNGPPPPPLRGSAVAALVAPIVEGPLVKAEPRPPPTQEARSDKKTTRGAKRFPRITRQCALMTGSSMRANSLQPIVLAVATGSLVVAGHAPALLRNLREQEAM